MSDGSGGADPPLLRSVTLGQSALFVEFGGQGYGHGWLRELRDAYAAYPGARPLIVACCEALQDEASSMDAQLLGFYRHGFDVLAWLRVRDAAASTTIGSSTGATPDPSPVIPPQDYLASAPISYPLVLVTQLAQYVGALQSIDKTPEQFNTYVRGAAGHSQGTNMLVLTNVDCTVPVVCDS